MNLQQRLFAQRAGLSNDDASKKEPEKVDEVKKPELEKDKEIKEGSGFLAKGKAQDDAVVELTRNRTEQK